MRKGQISLDFLFAVTLISILTLNLVYIGTTQKTQAETFDLTTKAKVFAVDIRDSVAKLYGLGDGFRVRKEIPFNLRPGDYVEVLLDNSTNTIAIAGEVGGKKFYTQIKSQVPIYEKSVIKLYPGKESFWIVATYNSAEGRVDVEVSP
ncbi:MAG: hypothetical protein J7L37_05930 [Thermococcus sp.]|nr:hypothetical protein [Thermococcus sp.]